MPRGLLFFRYREYRIDERQLPIWHQLVADYDVGGEEMAALRRIIDGVRGAGAVPILVRMPVTSDWVDMHPQGARDFRRFADALESFARVNGVAYADIASRFASLDDFADPVHLNGKGLARFTDALAGSIAQITSRGRA